MPLVEKYTAHLPTHFGSRFVLTKSNPLRILWNFVVTLLLVYTGTVFLYRLCFVDFHIQTEAEMNNPAEAHGVSDAADWASFDNVVAILFWVDLIINFFFSYDEEDAYEVDDIRLIARHYLKSDVWINLIACVPDALIEMLIESYIQGAPLSLNQSLRALRLQRMSRLARLTRLTRLAKLRQQRHSAWYQWLERQKGVHIVNLMIGLLWVLHFVACGWFLCAALHDSAADTWVGRRKTDPDGSITLVDSQPFDQWTHAMYFALTVFTTVGFGDISAVTVGEIFYVCFAMGVGVLVHSIIISEVINVVVSTDRVQTFIKNQTELVQAFAEHTELDFDMSRRLRRWVDVSAKNWVAEKYDRNEMKEILTGKFLPPKLLEQLPAALFCGHLLRNNFLWVCRNVCNMPPRLPLLVALALSKSTFSALEVIYHVHDCSFNLFLVASGTFAYVARPTRCGGMADIPTELARSEPPWAPLKRRRRSALATMMNVFSLRRKFMAPDEIPETNLFPYALFGHNSYFGDEGLATAAPRRQTARCESESGELLSLSKVDLKDLGDQFPQFGARWALLARQHERRHREMLSELTFGCTYRHLAAVRIQTWFRDVTSGEMRWRENSDRNSIVEMLTQAADSMQTNVGPVGSDIFQGLADLQRDMGRLTCVVGGLDDKVDKILSHFERAVAL